MKVLHSDQAVKQSGSRTFDSARFRLEHGARLDSAHEVINREIGRIPPDRYYGGSIFGGLIYGHYRVEGKLRIVPWLWPMAIFSGLIAYCSTVQLLWAYLGTISILILLFRDRLTAPIVHSAFCRGDDVDLYPGVIARDKNGDLFAAIYDLLHNNVTHLDEAFFSDGSVLFREGTPIMVMCSKGGGKEGNAHARILWAPGGEFQVVCKSFSQVKPSDGKCVLFSFSHARNIGRTVGKALRHRHVFIEALNDYFSQTKAIRSYLRSQTNGQFVTVERVKTEKPVQEVQVPKHQEERPSAQSKAKAGTPTKAIHSDLYARKLIVDPNDANFYQFRETESEVPKCFIGGDALKKKLRELSKMGKLGQIAICVTGESGTGKSFVPMFFGIKSVLSLNGATPEQVSDIFRRVRSNSSSGGILSRSLYLDNIDSLQDSDRSGTLLSSIIDELNGTAATGPGIVFFSAKSRTSLPEALRDRITYFVDLKKPDYDQRLQFITHRINYTKSMIGAAVYHEDYKAFLEQTNGLSYLQLEQLVDRSVVAYKQAHTFACFFDELKKFKAERGVQVSKKSSWKNLVLPEGLHDELIRMSKIIGNSENVRKAGFSIPRSAVLYGPPGTGKTEIARTLANEANTNFMAASAAEIKGSYLGHSAENVKKLFANARSKSPCILFIDEIEALAADRTGGHTDQYTDEIVTQLLQEMDGVKSHDADLFVLAATNHLDRIDSAILSRFNKKIEVPLPETKDRARMFWKAGARFVRPNDEESNQAFKKVVFSLAHESQGWSGRDIYSFVEAWSQHILSINLDLIDDPDAMAACLNPSALLDYFRTQGVKS